MNFSSAGADIEPCESDFVAVVSGALGISELPVQLLFGEAKTAGPIDENDVRKLGKLASAIPKHLAQSFILFSKTDTFSLMKCVWLKRLTRNMSVASSCGRLTS